MRLPRQAWHGRNRLCIMTVAEQALKLHVFQKKGRRLLCTETRELPLLATDAGPTSATGSILNKAVSCDNLRYLPFVLVLPPEMAQHRFFEAPHDLQGAYGHWIESRLQDHMPPGMSREQLLVGYRLFENLHNKTTVLASMVRREIVEAWYDCFQGLNLRLLQVQADFASMLNVLALDHGYWDQQFTLLHGDASIVQALRVDKGEVLQYAVDIPERILGVVDAASDGGDKSNNSSAQHAVLFDACHEPENGSMARHFGDTVRIQEMTARDLALGRALQYFFPMDKSRDLLPTGFRRQVKIREEKLTTVLWAGWLSLAMCVSLLILLAARLVVGTAFDEAKAEMELVQNRIQQIEILKNERQGLESRIASRTKLLSQRTRVSFILSEISRTIPDGVWLKKLEFGGPSYRAQNEGLRGNAIYVEGMALTDNGLTRLFSALEALDGVDTVRLDFLRTLPAKRVFKLTKKYRRALVSFGLHIVLTSERQPAASATQPAGRK